MLTISLTEGEAGGMWTADRRLWLTADGELVEDGDPRAAFLFCTPGYPVAIEQAKARGLISDDASPEPEPEKQAPKPKDKQAARARDKARAPAEDDEPKPEPAQETNP